MAEDVAQFGWKALAEMLGKSTRTCMRRKKALRDAGCISYTMRRNAVGRKYRAMFFFPSIIKAYIVRQSIEGDIF